MRCFSRECSPLSIRLPELWLLKKDLAPAYMLNQSGLLFHIPMSFKVEKTFIENEPSRHGIPKYNCMCKATISTIPTWFPNVKAYVEY